LNAIERALWHIESTLREPFSLDATARAAGISRFHLSRSFGFVTGASPSDYARARRLTEAARRLAAGEGDILSLALDFGYGSHEAFTRAFREQFSLTPEQVRTLGRTDTLNLMEPRTLTHTPQIQLSEPEIVKRGPLLLAGLSKHFQFSERGAIPLLWGQFAPLIASLPRSGPGVTFGVVSAPPPGEEGFEYAPSVQIASVDDLPEGLKAIRIAERTFAIFRHGGHVAEMPAVCNAIYSDWCARSDYRPAEIPLQMLEYYPESFNPATGGGGYEIWLPLAG
jgi:AraC family transcriptional regulator